MQGRSGAFTIPCVRRRDATRETNLLWGVDMLRVFNNLLLKPRLVVGLALLVGQVTWSLPPAWPALPPQGNPANKAPENPNGSQPEGSLVRKRQKDLLKFNFDKMKEDADELAALAKSLQEDLDKTNENVLSLKIVEKAEKIEKLAKKIKSAARGY